MKFKDEIINCLYFPKPQNLRKLSKLRHRISKKQTFLYRIVQYD